MMVGENTAPEMSLEEEREGLRLLRTCDAIELIDWAFEESIRRGDLGEDGEVQNARDELRILRESADWHLLQFKRKHNIPEL